MSECDGRDGYMRMINERGDAIQKRGERLRNATPDHMTVELTAHVNGDIVTMTCGLYRLVYGITVLPGGLEASYLPLRSYPIPGVSPAEKGIMAAAVDAYKKGRQSWHS